MGDSFQFVAVVWLAVLRRGALGVVAVRLADGLSLVLAATAAGTISAGMGVIFLANVGAKPIGLLAFGRLYTVFDPAVMFVVGGIVVLVLALTATAAVGAATRQAPAEAAAR